VDSHSSETCTPSGQAWAANVRSVVRCQILEDDGDGLFCWRTALTVHLLYRCLGNDALWSYLSCLAQVSHPSMRGVRCAYAGNHIQIVETGPLLGGMWTLKWKEVKKAGEYDHV
jgi:hypothetical protein